MNRLERIFKSILGSEVFEVDGFKYYFVKIACKEHSDYFHFKVNVELPKHGQSWIVERFEVDIREIIVNAQNLSGFDISYSLDILVDGKEASVLKWMYISPEKQKEILQEMNANMSTFTMNYGVQGDKYELSFNVEFYQGKERNYSIDDTSINFYYFLHLRNFILDDKPARPKLENMDKLAGSVGERLMDSDYFKNNIEEIIYRVLESEVQIRNIDSYYNANFYVDKIDGVMVEPSGYTWTISRKWFDFQS